MNSCKFQKNSRPRNNFFIKKILAFSKWLEVGRLSQERHGRDKYQSLQPVPATSCLKSVKCVTVLSFLAIPFVHRMCLPYLFFPFLRQRFILISILLFHSQRSSGSRCHLLLSMGDYCKHQCSSVCTFWYHSSIPYPCYISILCPEDYLFVSDPFRVFRIYRLLLCI